MDTYTTSQIAAQRIAMLHMQASKRRLFRQLRNADAVDRPKGRVWNGWLRANPRGSQVVLT